MNADGAIKADATIPDGPSPVTLLRRIWISRSLAKVVLFVQALVPASLWLISVLCLFLALSWFGLFRIMPDMIRVLSALGLLGAAVFAFLPLLRLRWPDHAAADRHLEDYNHLPHQAVSVQFDSPSAEGPFAAALWREHQMRMAARIGTLEVGSPSPDVARQDPYGLRALPILAVTIAYFFSGSQYSGRLTDVFRSNSNDPAGIALRIDAWVTPPGYTSSPPVFLTANENDPDQAVSVPQFSILTVRLSGSSVDAAVTFTPENGAPAITLAKIQSEKDTQQGGSENKNTELSATQNYEFKLDQNGLLSVGGREWSLTIQPDQKPTIAFEGAPRRTANGSLEIGFKGRDDYGFAEARAEILPADHQSLAVPLYPLPEYRLDIPRRKSRDIQGVTSRNLTEHPMAGTRVRVTLVAVDGAGQEGRSEPIEMTLPARSFQEPVAASLVEQRQTFALDANQVRRAIELANALAIRPEETIPDKVHYLLLQSAKARLSFARSLSDLRSTAEYFWQVALQIEDGDMPIAEKNLRDAQEALSDALAKNAPDAEIKKLMDELRKAMTAYLDAMQKRMAENPDSKLPNTAQNMLRQKDLQKMLDQLENLARSGSREEAQKLLSEMQRMMNNLQAVKPQGQEQRQNSEMTKQIDKLGDLLQNQQKLMDQTFSLQKQLEDRMQRGDLTEESQEPLFDEQQTQDDPSTASPDGENPSEGSPQQGSRESQMTEQQLRDALKGLQSRQNELSKNLEELNQGLKNLGLKPGKGFGDAKRHMRDASKSLERSLGDKATEGQGKALQALRDGAKDLMKQMQGQGDGGGQGQAGTLPQNTDPLGRQQQADGQGLDSDVKVPDEIDIQRAREILESIRRKLDTNLGPELERQYLERLLDMR